MCEIKFSCKDCVFAEYVSFKGIDTQYDCRLKRVQKLNPDNNSEVEDGISYFTFNRFCNARRPVEWLEKYCENDIQKAVEVVNKEVSPRLSIIIKFNYNMDTFKSIVESLYEQDYSRKFIIVVNDRPEYNLEIFELLESLSKNEKIVEYNILMPPDADYDTYQAIDDSLSFCKNGWIVFFDEGDVPSKSLTAKVNDRINNQMKRLVYCSKKDNRTFLIQAALYKLIGGNSPKMMEDGEVDNRTFLERIESLRAEDPDCISDWKDIFNE
jgi:hypothetical protein